MPTRPKDPTSDLDTLDTISAPASAPTSTPAGIPHVPETDPHAVAPTIAHTPLPAHSLDLETTKLVGDGFADRYELSTVLGSGGMGEVRLCKDKRIGREVALKLLHARSKRSTDAAVRFVREARVQGQLEHPAVVPVYDLGVGPDGNTYFTMKRVRGLTLEAIVNGLAKGDAVMQQRYSRRKLLTAFATVCLSIDFAHSRGVLHRDLKPGNVMLGDFGEVHVLDWGLAKVAGLNEARLGDDDGVLPRASAPPGTLVGALMGTPGYMAPEQVRGEIDRLDARSDVYALGAILFELLALERLHPAQDVHSLLLAALHTVDARPSVRAPAANVPPELDAICVRATATDPSDRFASARELSDALERYLDGDRDTQRRREMAAVHTAAAREAVARVIAGGDTARAARAVALREAGRAIALDPEDAISAALLAQLIMEVPEDVPAEAARELDAIAHRARAEAARGSAVRYLMWLAFVPAFAWMGARHWTVGLIAIGFIAASAAVATWMHRAHRADVPQGLALLLLSASGIALLSGLLGPLILVPGLAATNTVFFALHADRRHRLAIAAVGVLSIIVPTLLDALHVLPPAYAFAHGALLVLPRMTALPPHATMFVMLAVSVTLIITPAIIAGRVRDALTRAERRLFLQAWHLRQLVPDEARSTLAVATGARAA